MGPSVSPTGSPASAEGPATPATLEAWWTRRWSTRDGLVELLLALAELSAALGRVDNVGSAIFDLRPRALMAPGGPTPAASPDPWGEGRSVPAADERALSGTLAPELLFGCRREAPEAGHVWSIGLGLLGLLLLADAGRASGPPPMGTDTPSLRPLRATLINDVHRRKPAMFAGRRLPQQEFLYPDALPEADQAAAARALQSMREAGVLVDGDAVLQVLTCALMVSPAARTPTLARLAEALRGAAAACRSAPPVERGPAPPDLPPQQDAALQALIDRVGALERQLAAQGEGSGLVLAAGLAQLERGVADDRAALRGLQATVEGLRSAPAPVLPPRAPTASSSDWIARIGVLVVALGLFGLGFVGGRSAPEAPRAAASPAPLPRAAPAPRLADPAALADEPPPSDPVPSEASPSQTTASEAPEAGRPGERSGEPRAGAARPQGAKDKDAARSDAPRPEPDSVEPAAVPGRLVVRGGTASLVGPSGAADPSRVPPGAYRLKARTSDGKEVELGTVNVASGAVISVACGFGTCKRE